MIRSSYSKREAFQTCQRKYHLKYIEKLQQRIKPKPLRMGDAYSKALEAGSADVAKAYYEQLILSSLTGDSQYLIDDYVLESRMVHALADTYLKNVALPNVQREVKFDRSIEGINDIGFFDGLIFHDDGRITLIENKLKSMFLAGDEAALPMNTQLRCYVHALMNQYGIPIDKIDVRYEVALKPQIRQTKKETREMFLDRIEQVIYDDPMKYHKVFTPEMVEPLVYEVPSSIVNIHNQISTQEKLPEGFIQNTNRCGDFGGCEFLSLCKARDIDDIELALKEFKQKESNDELSPTSRGEEEGTGAQGATTA